VVTLASDLSFRGLVHQVSDATLLKMLDADSLVVYAGFDPSADSLHVGNLLLLCNLRRLQLAGHQPIAVAGGATGMIGDPGGKADERSLLSAEQIAANLAGIRPQLEKFLDFSPGPAQARLVDNNDWLGSYPFTEFLRDVGKHFTVNQMVAKESVRSRFERPDSGISYTEFSYMLLQAADFLHLNRQYGCRLQIGGSDQWGNITMGIDLIRKVVGETAYALTSPLVLKADGTKFGKSEEGALYLSAARTSPYELYQFFLRVEDAMVGTYLRYFSFLSHEELLELDAATAAHPEQRVAQRALARAMTTLVHSDEETARVERASEALYSESLASLDEATLLMVLDKTPASTRARSDLDAGLDLVDLLLETKLAASKTAARALILQGGVYVNNRRVDPEQLVLHRDELIADRYLVLRRGRRDLHLVAFA
jgi:tyrosyl-tRNA synthetase